ncbi:MAG: hypothetical protein RBS56_04645 [Candidatus Gracilibacteria bacterium]|nr:hypothetical protein [Candidatus Gracilibacteria bacterium]
MLKNISFKALKLTSLAFLFSLTLSATTFALTTNRVWDSSYSGCNGEWTTGACWYDEQEPTTRGIPDSDDKAYFPANSGDCVVPTGTTVNILSIYGQHNSTTYNGTLTFQESDITLANNFSWAGGTLNFGTVANGSATMAVGDDLNISGGTVNSESAIVTVGQDINITNGNVNFDESTYTIDRDVVITNGTINFGSATVNIAGDYDTSNSPTITLSSGTTTISGNVGITSGGTFNHNNGTIVLDGASSVVLDPGKALYNLTIDKDSSSYTVTNSNYNLATLGTLTVSGGKLIIDSRVLNSDGNLSLTGGEIEIAASATVDVEGTATISGGTFSVNNNSGAWDFNSSLSLSSGTFNAPTGDIWVHGAYNQSGGTSNFSSGKFEVDGLFTQSAGTLNMGTGTFQLDDDITISGTADFNGNPVAVLDLNATVEITSSVSVLSPYHTKMSGDSFTLGSNAAWGEGTNLLEFDSTLNTTVDIQNALSTESFGKIKVNMTGATSTLTLEGSDILSSVQELTLTDGTINSTGGKILLTGQLTTGSAFSGGTLNVEISGSATNNHYIGRGGVPKLTINNPNATVKPAYSTSIGSTTFTDTLTVTQGTFTTAIETGVGLPGSLTLTFADDITINGGNFILDTSGGNGLLFESFGSNLLTVSDGLFDNNLAGSVSLYNINQSGGIINFGADMDVGKVVNLSGGTLNTETSDPTFSGNFVQTGGIFNAGTGNTLIFSYAFSLATGTFNAESSSIYFEDSFTITSGTYNAGTSTTYFNDASNQVVNINSTQTFYNVIKNSNSTLIFSSGDTITVNDLSLLNGTLGINSTAELIVENDFTYDDDFDGNSSSTYAGYLTLKAYEDDHTYQIPEILNVSKRTPSFKLDNNGFDNVKLEYLGTADLSIFGRLMLTGSGSSSAFDNKNGVNITISNTTILESGTFYSRGGQMTHTGAVTISGGTYEASTSQVTFNSTYSQSLGQFNIINGSLDANNAFTLSGGTFNAPSGTFLMGNNMTISAGTYNHNNGTLTFDSGGNNSLNVPDGIPFELYNLTVNKASESSYFGVASNDEVVVSNTLRLENGMINLPNGGDRLVAENEINWLNTFDGNYGIGDGYLVIKTLSDVEIPEILTLSGRTLPSIRIDNSNKSDLLVEYTGTSPLIFEEYFQITDNAGTGATFSNSSSGSITFEYNYIQNAGTFLAGTLGNTITHEGTITMGASALFDLETADWISDTYNQTISNGTFDARDGSVTVLQNFILDGGTFLAPSGTFDLGGNLSLTGGSFQHNGGSMIMSGSGNFSYTNTTGDHLNNIEINNDSTLEGLSSLIGDLYLDGNFTLTRGLFNGGTGNRTITITGNLIRDTANTTVTPGNSTVVLTEGDHSITGSNTFYNFTKIGSSELVFEAGSTTTITGTWTCQGASEGNRLVLRSSIPGTGLSQNQWIIDPQGPRIIANLDVQDSYNQNLTAIDARGTGSIPHEEDPNNFNWLFDAAPEVTNLGPPGLVDGSQTSDKTPTLTFDVEDENDDLVEHRIQIATDPSFSSLVVDFSSGYLTEGSKTFTVGQEVGANGSYAVGSVDQELSDDEYYWRVMASNQASLQSDWVTANSGSIAFIVDGTAPGPVIQKSPINGNETGDTTPRLQWYALTDPSVESYVIDVWTMDDILIETAIINDPSATYYDMTEFLGYTTYKWRIYAVDTEGLSGLDQGLESETTFKVINLVPEFNTYLYTLMFLAGAYFIFKMRRKEEM